MTPDELKNIRKGLGWTQQQLADALGMSRKAIVEMEGDKAPIEQRTALAVMQLFNQHSRIRSAHRVIEFDDDVPLAKAQIIWDRYGEVDPPVRLIGIPGKDDDRYSSSGGACNSDWQHSDDVGRLLRLFAYFVELTVDEKIPAEKVHDAFSIIPEYRWAMHCSLFKEGIDA